MKYCIQHKVGHGKTAGSKAVRDVRDILIGIGYKPLNVYKKFYHYSWSILKLYLTLDCNDEVVLQWPFYFMPIRPVFWVLKKRKVQLTLLIHDLNSLRNEGNNSLENVLLEYADVVIAHTDAMKDYLKNKGVDESKISVLTSFDYLTTDKTLKRDYSNKVVFAGNLAKSEFLMKIPQDCFGLNFNCYGLPKNVIPSHLTYKGAFKPENISILEGSWGLVWDGESVETCSGVKGEYMKINSPHKVSLYIVAGLPVIIWNQSALADYIVKNNLGIAINSLSEIKYAIEQITVEQYKNMVHSVGLEAEKLKKGEHFKAIIQSKCK